MIRDEVYCAKEKAFADGNVYFVRRVQSVLGRSNLVRLMSFS